MENLEHTEKVSCFAEQLNIILKKIESIVFNFFTTFIELRPSPQEIENANTNSLRTKF